MNHGSTLGDEVLLCEEDVVVDGRKPAGATLARESIFQLSRKVMPFGS